MHHDHNNSNKNKNKKAKDLNSYFTKEDKQMAIDVREICYSMFITRTIEIKVIRIFYFRLLAIGMIKKLRNDVMARM